MQILNSQQELILKEERILLNELRVTLVQIGTAPEDQETLSESIRQLEEIFLLVVVGEFNAGKSAFINALLGQRYLKEGVTPTTTQINVLRYNDTQERKAINENLLLVSLPAEILQEISIVDTPGTNAIIREHEQITSEFIPRSDLVLFITSADRPFTESENVFLKQIRDWGKKVVIIINKLDIIEANEEIDQIIQYVSDNAFALLGIRPDIFPISARLALKAKQGDPAHWSESRFEALEKYIRDTLDEKSRVQLKLLSPLGVSKHLVTRYSSITQARLDLLRDDFQTIDDINSQCALFREDMLRDFNFRMADIENILFEMEQRGDQFFEETFRIARLLDLLSKSRIQNDFENIVVADAPQRIDLKVQELIDWMVEENLAQWQAVHNHLSERRKQYQSRIIGDNAIGTFHYDRERLIDAIGMETRRIIDTYNKQVEANEIANSAQEAVAASAAFEVGAVGLGALITAIATTVAADVTGILLASVVAALGLFVIPARRRQAKNELRKKVTELREKLTMALRTQFEREIERGLHEIQEAIAPYIRFIRAEQTKLEDTGNQLKDLHDSMSALEIKIQSL